MVVRIVDKLTRQQTETLQKAVIAKGGYVIREEEKLQGIETEYERPEMPWDKEK